MISLSLNKMKLIANFRGIKDYRDKSKDESKEILSKPESKINYLKLSIKQIREKFNDSKNRFSKSKIKEIKRRLYTTENKEILSTQKIKKIEFFFLELEENLLKLKKYNDYDFS